jgi:hypothetical protein
MRRRIKMNFRQLDLNLLRVLGAVYRSGSVTEAGRQLALSQPATSNALARLRRYFGDALFVPWCQPCSASYFACSSSGDSTKSGCCTMQSAGQTSLHCGSSSAPTHSVQRNGSIT